MTVSFDPHSPAGVRPACGTMPHPLESCLHSVESAFGLVAGVSAEGLEAEALAGLLARSQRVVAQSQALLFKLTSAADRAKTAKTQGSASTADLLSSNLGGDRADSARNVRTANAIHKTLTQTAMEKGLITLAQAEVIVRTLSGLPSNVTVTQRLGCEEALIEAAQKLTLKDLRRRADRIGDIFAPDKATADKLEQQTLVERERAARAKTTFWMLDQKDGTFKGGFVIPEMHADMLKTMLDAIAAPRRDHLRQDQLDAFGDLTWPRRQGLAFLELLEHTPVDHLPAGSTTLTVNFDHDQLLEGIGAATLSTGTRVSINEVRRIACEANLIPMVFNGESLPLNMGRGKRLFTRHQRLAIANRDGGCTFPGCDRPPNWCEIHHANCSWAQGGETNLCDGVLLCNLHHHVIHEQSIHDDGWAIRFAADGHPEYLPPKSIDFRQKPRRNHRWSAKQGAA